jgi:hypothetical protein
MISLLNSLISNYFFKPIYNIYDIFVLINNEYIDYVKKIYGSNITDADSESNLDFVMTNKFDNLDEIKSNSKIFIKTFIKPTQTNLDNEIEYVIGFRKIHLFYKIVRFIHYLNEYLNFTNYGDFTEEKLFSNNIESYTIYKLNLHRKSIQIHLISSNSYQKIKKNISVNYILISNILYYSNSEKYTEIIYSNYDYSNYDDDYKQLLDKWIEPIDPDDYSNYKKISSLKINEEIIKIDNNIYTDILCFRNFIQYDYQNGLRILYPNPNEINEFNKMPILFTTYRINENKQILTILH